MIIELFGLPGSGKSTLSRAWRKDGVTVVRALSRPSLITETLRFVLFHPRAAFSLGLAIMRYSPPRLRRSLFLNLFVVQQAKYQRARRLSRKGSVVVIDQGPFQSVLSVFSEVPDDTTLARFVRCLPKPDMLLCVEVPHAERMRRQRERGWTPRADFGEAEAARFAHVSEEIYARLPSLLEDCGVTHRTISGAEAVSLSSVLPVRLTYVTAARMPTEKAHGVSIAHMCASFARAGLDVVLVTPTRRTSITDDIWTYYAVPRSFSVRRIMAPDLLSRGLTHPVFFFAQRLLFLCALGRRSVLPGVVYTREPEIAWRFAPSRTVVFEAHDWPAGWRGRLQSFLVRRSTLIVCNSKGTQAAAHAHGCAHTIVAPNGFSPEQFAADISKEDSRAMLDIEPGATVVMYVGALDARKGVQALFDAASLLEDVTVAIVGGGAAQVSELTQNHPVVRFLGFRPYRDIATTLAAADMLVLPNSARSVESSTFTSPIKLFAYMASGVPIIASDVLAVRAFLTDANALLVPPDDPQLLAAGIRTVCADPAAANERAAQARIDVQQYTWDARAKKILEALRATIAA